MTGLTLYECADCGLHYIDPNRAEECFRHCTTYHSCNLAITKDSVERQASSPQPTPPVSS